MQFALPAGLPFTAYSLQVVASGVASDAVGFVPTAYADRSWATLSTGSIITDADLVASGPQQARVGTNAFASVNDAVTAATPVGATTPLYATVVVNGYDGVTSGTGVFHENVTDKTGVSMSLQYGAVTFDSLTIQGKSGTTPAASVTVTATLAAGTGGITFDVGGVTSAGTLTLQPGTTANRTALINSNGTSSGTLEFDNGSSTAIGTPATAPSSANNNAIVAYIDLHGHNALVTGTSTGSAPNYVPGAIFINNGYVVDLSGTGSHLIADGQNTPHGALVKGAGWYQSSVVTQNQGYFQAGNSPGIDYFSQFTFGPGGAGDYNFVIDDAAGIAGPRPTSAGQVDGWSLVTAGDFAFTADADHRLTVHLQTLANLTTVGNDLPGSAANFDPTKSYVWAAVKWTGTYTGPTDVAALNAATDFDTTGFANAFDGTFGWSLDLGTNTLFLTYTPAA